VCDRPTGGIGPPASYGRAATPGEIFMPVCDSENRAHASNINVIH